MAIYNNDLFFKFKLIKISTCLKQQLINLISEINYFNVVSLQSILIVFYVSCLCFY
jgi:hypothetical protein